MWWEDNNTSAIDILLSQAIMVGTYGYIILFIY